jgi:hypothetical protein
MGTGASQRQRREGAPPNTQGRVCSPHASASVFTNHNDVQPNGPLVPFHWETQPIRQALNPDRTAS